jgi:hypothetical protein
VQESGLKQRRVAFFMVGKNGSSSGTQCLGREGLRSHLALRRPSLASQSERLAAPAKSTGKKFGNGLEQWIGTGV